MIELLPFSVAWFGAAIAVVQVAVLFVHLARRYGAIPKRLPLGLRFDGRPRAPGAKAWLWVAPAVLAAVVAGLCVRTALEPGARYEGPTDLLAFLVLAESAWLVQWTIDRQIEIARGMTYRVAPQRLLLVVAPVVVTLCIALAFAISRSL